MLLAQWSTAYDIRRRMERIAARMRAFEAQPIADVVAMGWHVNQGRMRVFAWSPTELDWRPERWIASPLLK